jgi:hypothetical protein
MTFHSEILTDRQAHVLDAVAPIARVGGCLRADPAWR